MLYMLTQFEVESVIHVFNNSYMYKNGFSLGFDKNKESLFYIKGNDKAYFNNKFPFEKLIKFLGIEESYSNFLYYISNN